jgi:hypothetical protein
MYKLSWNADVVIAWPTKTLSAHRRAACAEGIQG